RRAITTIAADPDVDAMIVIYIPPQATKAAEIGRAIAQGIDETGRRIPIATTWMSTKGLPAALRGGDVRVPSFAFPEQAAIAMAHACHYGRWRERPQGTVPRFADLRVDEAVGVIAGALGRGDEGWLTADELERLLDCYGLRTARNERAATPEDAAAAAGRIGATVAVKAFGPDIVHKTEVGAVRLGLRGPDQVATAAREMAERVSTAGLTLDGFVVQEMIGGDGVEMLVGVAHDPLFGPVVAVSAGGTTVELVRDVAVRVSPITDVDASDMVRSLRTFPLLEGFRGARKADVAALEETILRVGALVDNHPAIVEMDCNPVMVLPEGAVIVDARVKVQEAPLERPLASRAAGA
ncbi:MAG TPA: acetate--CoA ligase family protein, partial [Actinomycetota bacterium]|nr:acetate--CoA ligase family protein [Actinomycetota bacterium]